jgi:hypothetical protein
MVRSFRLAWGVAVALAIVASEARAQYYPGYGGYGWGGWGGGATVQGDIARGLGYYNMGAGVYNEKTAIANSINADTVMRFNNYLFQSQREASRREYQRMAQRQNTINATADSIHQRLRDNPTASDVHSGDALNVVLDEITDPRIHSSALRMATEQLSSDIIDDIPFVNASEAVSLSLNQLTAKDAWPTALLDDEFTPARQEWEKAVADALKEDEAGRISPQTLRRVKNAASTLRAKLEENPPDDRTQLIEAKNYVKTLLGLSRMLENPRVEKAIAALEKHPKTTLGSLLGFMHAYNLRFGPANKADQREIYDNLYPKLVAHRDRVYKDTGIADVAPPKVKGHPTDFFQGMHLDHLEGKDTPTPQ